MLGTGARTPRDSSCRIRLSRKVYLKPSAYCGAFSQRLIRVYGPPPFPTATPARSLTPVYIVAIAWLYVVILMAITETSITAGVLTFALYGVLPLALLLWLMGTPIRRRLRQQSQTIDQAMDAGDRQHAQPDQGDLADGRAELRAPVESGDQVGNRDVDHARAGQRE